MAASISVSQSAILLGLWNFLKSESVLGAGVPVIDGQQNRTPEPSASDYVVITPSGRSRISTNVDALNEITFNGSISGNMLTITEASGNIVLGASISGPGISAPLTVIGLPSGPQTASAYTLSGSASVPQSALFAGIRKVTQSTEVRIQCDIHGPNSEDNAQIITTLFRDRFACDFLAQYDVFPLYADDPKQSPFSNAEAEVEDMWIVDLHMQVNPTLTLPQQFAGSADFTFVPADQE